MKIRVFAYLRVSTANQLDGDGFDRQMANCEKFAQSKGWEIVRDFREQQSGADSAFERPKLSEALGLCTAATGVEIIVLERIDRLGRDLIVCELFFRECKRLGVRVFAADSGEELVNADADPTRKLIRQVLGALAEWNKSELVRKLQSGRRATKRASGRHCGGRYGFGWHPDHDRRADERQALQHIVAARLRGASWRDIAELLTHHRFKTASGRLGWGQSSVRSVFDGTEELRATLDPLPQGHLPFGI